MKICFIIDFLHKMSFYYGCLVGKAILFLSCGFFTVRRNARIASAVLAIAIPSVTAVLCQNHGM